MATSKAMTSDLDIYRSAKLLIDQHGEDAARHAAVRADALLEAGDMEGKAVAAHSERRQGAATAGAGRESRTLTRATSSPPVLAPG